MIYTLSLLLLFSSSSQFFTLSLADDDDKCRSSADGSCKNDDIVDAEDVNCGIYMAPSTVGNHSNLGIFTSKPMKDGDVVPFPEIIIPLLFRTFDGHPEIALDDGELWDRYIWEQYVGGIEQFADHGHEGSKEKAACFIPGVGCTVNSMLGLANIESANGSEFDEVVTRDDPGAGAFTPYHSSPTIIRAPGHWIYNSEEEYAVDAGQELFASYGDEWIPFLPDVAVTYEHNFKKADQLMENFEDWIVEKEEESNEEFSDELLKDMWDIMLDFPHHGEKKWEELSVLPKEWNRDTLKKLKEAKKTQPKQDKDNDNNNNVATPTSVSEKYWANKGKVPINFLKEHGKCQDHLRPDISKIPHAGRGAFATRDLPKGTIVGFAPLIHVAVQGENIFEIEYNGESVHGMERKEYVEDEEEDEEDDNDEEDDEEETKKRSSSYSKQDLVVNYSFGHRNSTLHLTPYGSIVNYINHKSSSDVDGPNVRIQWPKKEFVSYKSEWLNNDIDFLRDTIDKIGLSFDYVALRDIKEGEEVTMDYGDEWDNAWKEHVENWIVPEDTKDYVHSTKFEEMYLRTTDELKERGEYPWNLHTLCTDYYKFEDRENVNPTTMAAVNDVGVDDNDSEYIKLYDNSLIDTDDKVLYKCKVLHRREISTKEFDDDDDEYDYDNDGEGPLYSYSVEIELSAPPIGENNNVIVVHNFPQGKNGVNLYDKAYSQMWHMEHTFRNKMYIPDDMFPTSWMNNEQ